MQRTRNPTNRSLLIMATSSSTSTATMFYMIHLSLQVQVIIVIMIQETIWTNQNQGNEEWTKIISGYTRMAPEQLKGLALPPYEKTVDAAGINEVVELMRRNGMIEGAFDAKALIYRTAAPR